MEKEKFEEYLERKNDRIDNAAYELACAILDKNHNGSDNETVLPWNMEVIGSIVDLAEKLLEQMKLPACHPYHCYNDSEEEIPCFESADCTNADCPFKKG